MSNKSPSLLPEHPLLFTLKTLLLFLFYFILVEPFYFHHLSTDLIHLVLLQNIAPFIYIIVIILSIILGIISGNHKRSFFSLSDFLLIAILLATLLFANSRYILLPSECSFKYIYFLFLLPLISIIRFYLPFTSTSISPNQSSFIIPDLSLATLAKKLNKSIIDLDKET